jgi:REP element-mobilizing transposase RayT
MPRSRYRIFDTEHPHFLTGTIVGWLPVFSFPEAVEIVFDSWRWLQRERGLEIYGYVVLENHFHLIAAAPDLANAIKSFKMYTARRILAFLDTRGAKMWLAQLRAMKLPHKTESDYQLWQEGSHAEQIDGRPMMEQKLEYTHLNPVRRRYVDRPEHWRYSSARNYLSLPARRHDIFRFGASLESRCGSRAGALGAYQAGGSRIAGERLASRACPGISRR